MYCQHYCTATRTDNVQSTLFKNAFKRLQFERNLRTAGLVLEKELSPDGRTGYVKIYAPFDVLCEQVGCSPDVALGLQMAV